MVIFVIINLLCLFGIFLKGQAFPHLLALLASLKYISIEKTE